MQANVRAFAEAQRDSLKDFEIEIRPGVHLGQKNLPINAVGAYVPRHLCPSSEVDIPALVTSQEADILF